MMRDSWCVVREGAALVRRSLYHVFRTLAARDFKGKTFFMYDDALALLS
jgi:hypothetical protein